MQVNPRSARGELPQDVSGDFSGPRSGVEDVNIDSELLHKHQIDQLKNENEQMDQAKSLHSIADAATQGLVDEKQDLDHAVSAHMINHSVDHHIDHSGHGGIDHNNHPGTTTIKPKLNSAEWHRVRKENHKEVERRRRENINEGIKALAEVLHTSDKSNKAEILKAAAGHIKGLQQEKTETLEQHTMEKILMEQSIAELQSKCDKLKQNLESAWKELEYWKNKGQGNQ